MSDTPSIDHEAGPMVVIDDIDRAIIKELQEDGRRTYGRIATAVGLTEAPARQRVWRLTRSGVIEIVAIINPGALGFGLRATIGLQCTGDFSRLVTALRSIDEIDWLVATAGGFDLLAEIRCRDEQHLYAVAEQIRSLPGVDYVESFIYLNLFKASYSWPPGSGKRVRELPTSASPEIQRRPVTPGSEAVLVDDLDWAIIGELRADGRQTYGRIAKTVGVSLGVVRQRVPQLIAADVIRIAAIVNPRVQGFHMRATLGIRCVGNLDGVAMALSEIDEIESLYAVAGRFDLLAEIQCRDQQHLLQVLAEQVRTLPGVRGAEAVIFLDILKIRYPWPPVRLPLRVAGRSR